MSVGCCAGRIRWIRRVKTGQLYYVGWLEAVIMMGGGLSAQSIRSGLSAQH